MANYSLDEKISISAKFSRTLYTLRRSDADEGFKQSVAITTSLRITKMHGTKWSVEHHLGTYLVDTRFLTLQQMANMGAELAFARGVAEEITRFDSRHRFIRTILEKQWERAYLDIEKELDAHYRRTVIPDAIAYAIKEVVEGRSKGKCYLADPKYVIKIARMTVDENTKFDAFLTEPVMELIRENLRRYWSIPERYMVQPTANALAVAGKIL